MRTRANSRDSDVSTSSRNSNQAARQGNNRGKKRGVETGGQNDDNSLYPKSKRIRKTAPKASDHNESERVSSSVSSVRTRRSANINNNHSGNVLSNNKDEDKTDEEEDCLLYTSDAADE